MFEFQGLGYFKFWMRVRNAKGIALFGYSHLKPT